MPMMSEVLVGQQFPFVSQVTTNSTTTGMVLTLFGQDHEQVATISIALDGTVTGSMNMDPSTIPVTIIESFTPVTPGDVLSNDNTGETMVCRWSKTKQDGSVIWGASLDQSVVYSPVGWSVIGHITLPTS